MPKYTVSQTFETLGDPCCETFDTIDDAEIAAENLRRELVEMISEWETPHRFECHPTGCTFEIQAWEEAQQLAGVEYGDMGYRKPGCPLTYGIKAGELIANAAVSVVETDE